MELGGYRTAARQLRHAERGQRGVCMILRATHARRVRRVGLVAIAKRPPFRVIVHDSVKLVCRTKKCLRTTSSPVANNEATFVAHHIPIRIFLNYSSIRVLRAKRIRLEGMRHVVSAGSMSETKMCAARKIKLLTCKQLRNTINLQENCMAYFARPNKSYARLRREGKTWPPFSRNWHDGEFYGISLAAVTGFSGFDGHLWTVRVLGTQLEENQG